MRKLLTALLFAAATFPALAHEMPGPKTGSAELERMKKLAGTWTGTTEMEKGKPQVTSLSYKVTSNGSAVVETLMENGPGEMTTMYYDDEAGKLTMTHYCALGNRPRMKLKTSDGTSIVLDFVKSEGINPKKDEHMHGLTLVTPDGDHLEQRWTHYTKGKQDNEAVFKFTRSLEAKKQP